MVFATGVRPVSSVGCDFGGETYELCLVWLVG
jgi:hypothetical protein